MERSSSARTVRTAVYGFEKRSLAGERMSYLQSTVRRIGIAGELVSFFMGHKRWWMLPMILVVLLLAVLVTLAQSSVLAPFFYTLF